MAMNYIINVVICNESFLDGRGVSGWGGYFDLSVKFMFNYVLFIVMLFYMYGCHISSILMLYLAYVLLINKLSS